MATFEGPQSRWKTNSAGFSTYFGATFTRGQKLLLTSCYPYILLFVGVSRHRNKQATVLAAPRFISFSHISVTTVIPRTFEINWDMLVSSLLQRSLTYDGQVDFQVTSGRVPVVDPAPVHALLLQGKNKIGRFQ